MSSSLARMPIGRRLQLISLSFAVPIAVMVWIIVAGVNANLRFVSLEVDGVRYLTPLNQLLVAVGDHADGARTGGAQAGSAARAVDAALTSLAALDDVAIRLQFTDEGLRARKREHATLANFRKEWAELQAASGQSAEDSAVAHRHLVDDVRTMIAQAGDTSNLVLDPDLDSFYTMDAVVVALPQNQARLIDVGALSGRLDEQVATPSGETANLAAFGAMLKESDADRIASDLESAFNEDANFNGVSPTLKDTLAPVAAQFVDASRGVLDSIAALVNSGDVRMAGLGGKVREARSANARLWTVAAGELTGLLENRKSILARERTMDLAVSGSALIAALLLVFFITRSITGPLAQTTAELTDGSRQSMAASEQVASSAQSLAQGATEQAASLEETSASMEEMASMTRRNAESARHAVTLVGDVHDQVHQSQGALSDMVQSMSAIQESSQKVSKIIKTIDEIAFQTNILALNAAVEAARAGEAGMGFAVVADEVRNLAQRSAQAAKDTSALIEESIARSQAGTAKVAHVAASIGSITDAVNRVKGLIDEVNEASRQQTQGIDQVAQALAQMEKVTQGTAATAEESAAASEELSATAATTMTIVEQLRGLVGDTAVRAQAKGDAAKSPAAATATRVNVVSMSARRKPSRTERAEDIIPLEKTGTFGSF